MVGATEGLVADELLRRAEEALHAWKVVLPAPSTLQRLVASVSARAQQQLFEHIAGCLTPQIAQEIDTLLQVPEGEQRSLFFRFKEDPPAASAVAITTRIERYDFLRSIGIGHINLSAIPAAQVRCLAQLAARYDVRALKRFAPAKRYALVLDQGTSCGKRRNWVARPESSKGVVGTASTPFEDSGRATLFSHSRSFDLALVICFLVEIQKTLLDQVVALHDQFLTALLRKSRNSFERRYRDLRQRAKKGWDTLLRAIEILLSLESPGADVLDELYRQIDKSTLCEARNSCRAFQQLEEHGYVNTLSDHYPHLRRYLPTFFELPFQGEPGAEALLKGLALVRALNARGAQVLPWDAPLEFVPTAWRSALQQEDGSLRRSVWEIALAQAVRDALRSGDFYLAESRRHVSFWHLVYEEPRWNQERGRAYAQLALPSQAQAALERLQQEFDAVAQRTAQGMPQNGFAAIRDDHLCLKRPDALDIPDRVRELRRVIETQLPRVRIEDVLAEVDAWCGFTSAFQPLGEYQSRSAHLPATLLAALIAHGTNLGIAAMGHSAEGITVDMLQQVSHWWLREETLKAANAALVNYHHRLDLSAVWGEGTASSHGCCRYPSSSDGQRFGIQADSLLAAFYPRYFGYYDRAVTVYTHLSDQYSVYGTRAISCAPREALYVLDGLLENDTVLRIREHYTDTYGYTEHIFGLCHLLGYSFMPRIRDLKDQQLYKIERGRSYGCLDPLFRGGIDTALIQTQWDALVRVAASLRNRTAPAHVVVQRLAGGSPADRLAKALTALGRVVKTIYILRYLHEEEVRRRVQLPLNRGESRHALARWLFFANQGQFRTGDYEEIMNKATCLSLLSNAVLVWNTVYMAKIVAQLRAAGETVLDEDLARISPLAYSHVIPNGTYHFRQVAQA